MTSKRFDPLVPACSLIFCLSLCFPNGQSSTKDGVQLVSMPSSKFSTHNTEDWTKEFWDGCGTVGHDVPLCKVFIRELLENYCFAAVLTNRVLPQISDDRPGMRHRALFVASRAAWRWNKMLLARENVDSPLVAMVVATEHNAL